MTITNHISIKTLGRYEATLAKTMKGQAFRAHVFAAKAGVRELKRVVHTIKPFPPIDKRAYIDGFKVKALAASGQVEIVNTAPHAVFVEKGRRKGARRPPVEAITPWVRRKFGLRGKRARSMAFAVSTSISRKGIKKKPVSKMAAPGIKRAYLKALRDYNLEWLKKAGQ